MVLVVAVVAVVFVVAVVVVVVVTVVFVVVVGSSFPIVGSLLSTLGEISVGCCSSLVGWG